MGCCFSETSEKHSSFAYSTPSVGGIETSKAPPIVPYIPPDYHGVPDGIMTDTDAILLASNYCKDSPFQWHDEVLMHIGCRPLKWNFLVKGVDTETSKTVPMVLTIVYVKDFPIPLTNSTTLDVFANLVCGMANPYILSCEDADYIKDRSILVVIRKFCEKGSLKDLIYGKQNPKNPYADKYRRDNGRPLRPKMVRTFGRHVLEALSALNAKGIVCDCLHSGNVMIDGNLARIVELELTMLGGSIHSELLEMLVNFDIYKDGKACELDVMLFGLLLLEMATGAPHHKHSFLGEVESEFCERQGLSSPEGAAIREILCSIFVSCDATVDSLLSDPFFHDVELASPSLRLKFQSVEKGLIKSAMAAGADRRRQVREVLQSSYDKQEEERARIDRDAEEAAVMDDVVNKRRSKPNRRHSLSTVTDGSKQNATRRMSRRQSSGTNVGSSSANTSRHSAPPPPSEETSLVVSPLAGLQEQESSEAGIVVISNGAGSNMPPQYQKLLNIGLAQEQVKHKMLADGFDPSTVGW